MTAIDDIKEDVGVRFDLVINIRSDKAKQSAAVAYQGGVNNT